MFVNADKHQLSAVNRNNAPVNADRHRLTHISHVQRSIDRGDGGVDEFYRMYDNSHYRRCRRSIPDTCSRGETVKSKHPYYGNLYQKRTVSIKNKWQTIEKTFVFGEYSM